MSLRGPALAPGGFLNFRWGAGDELFVYGDEGAREGARLDGADARAPAGAGGSVALRFHDLSGARRRLAAQLHATFARLQAAATEGEVQLRQYSREYRASVRECIDGLAAEEAAARRDSTARADAADDLAAELEQHEWAECIMHLAEIFFLEPGEYVGEALVRWVQLHVVEPAATAPLTSALVPEQHADFWPTFHRLLLHGRMAEARELLGAHTQLRAHAALGAPVRAGADGEPSVGELLGYLDLLIENRPTLSSADQLLDFRGHWRAWLEDAAMLGRRHERDLPAGALTALRILRGDERALLEGTGGWTSLVLALVVHAQPTLRRSELDAVVNYAIAQFPEDNYSDNDYILMAIMLDNPSEALDNIAATYGRGWLLCHLSDLLARAGQVAPRPVDASSADAADGATDHALALRDYSRVLSATRGLWQLAAGYLAPLPRPLARACVGALVRAEPPSTDAKADKLLVLCEQYALQRDGATIATQVMLRKLRANMPAAALGWFARTPENFRQRARHDAIARALVRACEGGERGADGAAAPAAAALARLLGGLVGGPDATALPESGWLVEYCALRAALERLGALRVAAATAAPDAARGAADARLDACRAEAETRALVLRLCSVDTDAGGARVAADVPPAVRTQLLRDAHAAGLFAVARHVGAPATGELSVADVYALVGCLHSAQPALGVAHAAAADDAQGEWAGMSAALQPVALELCMALSSVILARPQARP